MNFESQRCPRPINYLIPLTIQIGNLFSNRRGINEQQELGPTREEAEEEDNRPAGIYKLLDENWEKLANGEWIKINESRGYNQIDPTLSMQPFEDGDFVE